MQGRKVRITRWIERNTCHDNSENRSGEFDQHKTLPTRRDAYGEFVISSVDQIRFANSTQNFAKHTGRLLNATRFTHSFPIGTTIRHRVVHRRSDDGLSTQDRGLILL